MNKPLTYITQTKPDGTRKLVCSNGAVITLPPFPSGKAADAIRRNSSAVARKIPAK